MNRTIQESLNIYKQDLASQAIYNPKTPAYTVKSALRQIIKVYNQKLHSTTSMTPNEAYLQLHIRTRQIKNFSAEEIRAKVVQMTTSKAEYFAKLGIPVKVGDPVLVKNCCRIKIRLDGTRLLIPPKEGHNHGKFIWKATVHQIVGNCYNLEWGIDSP